jgi:hypothetical protein
MLDIRNAGADDSVFSLLPDLHAKLVPGDLQAGDIGHRAEAFASTAYPDAFKEWYDRIAITKMSEAEGHSDAAGQSSPDLAGMIQKWGQLYEQQIKKPQPNALLYLVGHSFLNELKYEGRPLDLVHQEIDRAFAAAAPDNPVLQELDGDYLTDRAWLARGSGWANTVTAAQWTEFAAELEKADAVLEAAYAKHPEESEISVLMVTVELGQGNGRDRMEQWFQRAIQANPQNGEAYAAKFWYLQPRWYGSEDDLVSFGQQGLAMPNPPPGALNAFAVAIAEAADQDPGIYQRPEVWDPVEKNYRKYLALYPQSIILRTSFAKHAADSGHLGIAKEQFDLLGDNWDRGVLKDAEYARDIGLANANSAGGSPPTTAASPTPGG